MTHPEYELALLKQRERVWLREADQARWAKDAQPLASRWQLRFPSLLEGTWDICRWSIRRLKRAATQVPRRATVPSTP